MLSHPDQQSRIPQVELQEAPLLLLLLLLRPAVRHKRPGGERGEPAAALHRSGVCVCVQCCCCVCLSVGVCYCVCVSVCVSHPPSLALSLHLGAAFLRWTRPPRPIRGRQRLRGPTRNTAGQNARCDVTSPPTDFRCAFSVFLYFTSFHENRNKFYVFFFQLWFKTFFFFLLCLTSQAMKWHFTLKHGFILKSNK